MAGIKNDQGKTEAIFFYIVPAAILHGNHFIREIAYEIEDLICNTVMNPANCPTHLRNIVHYILDYLDEQEALLSVDAVCDVSKLGAIKYGLYNYQDGLAVDRLINALCRHFSQWLHGEYFDTESGVNHIYHMLANVYMLAYTLHRHPQLNNMEKVYGKYFAAIRDSRIANDLETAPQEIISENEVECKFCPKGYC